MSERLEQHLRQARAAIINGNADEAVLCVEKIYETLEQEGLSEGDRQRLEPALAELRALAEAALKGTKQAHDYVTSILQTARYLQTYDSAGQRQAEPVAERRTERF